MRVSSVGVRGTSPSRSLCVRAPQPILWGSCETSLHGSDSHSLVQTQEGLLCTFFLASLGIIPPSVILLSSVASSRMEGPER